MKIWNRGGSLRRRRLPGLVQRRPVLDRRPAHQRPRGPLSGAYRGCRGLERRRPFRPLLLFFFPPSYTHRPWFTPPAAPARSLAGVRRPTNDFVCVLVEIDSRPPKPSPGSHMPRGLGRVGDSDLPCSRPPVLDFFGGLSRPQLWAYGGRSGLVTVGKPCSTPLGSREARNLQGTRPTL